MNKDIVSKTKISFYWDVLGSGILQLNSFAITLVLARLLTPEDYGVVGISLVFVSIIQVFMEVGMTQGIIQRKNVSNNVLSTIFIINVSISVFLGFVLLIFAPIIAAFYDNSELSQIIRYLAIVPFISALSKVHYALLIKKFLFRKLVISQIIAATISGTVGIVAALNGYGAYSLVWQQISLAISTSILLWIMFNWKPSFVFSWTETNSIMSFSLFVFFDAIIQQFFRKLDTLFVGKYFSSEILGYYSRAESLKSMVNAYTSRSLGKVVFPALSALNEDAKAFYDMFSKSLSIASFMSVLIAGTLFFSADWLILFLLGENWTPVIFIFKILIFTTVTLPLRTLIVQAILAKGKSKVKMYIGLLSNVFTGAGIVVGYYYGFELYVWSVMLIRWFILIGVFWYGMKLFDLQKQILYQVIYPILILVGVVFLNVKVDLNFGWLSWLMFFLVVYFSLMTIIKHSGLIWGVNFVKNISFKINMLRK